jgi:hypothetical protein
MHPFSGAGGNDPEFALSSIAPNNDLKENQR